jgi:hypothetical protein
MWRVYNKAPRKGKIIALPLNFIEKTFEQSPKRDLVHRLFSMMRNFEHDAAPPQRAAGARWHGVQAAEGAGALQLLSGGTSEQGAVSLRRKAADRLFTQRTLPQPGSSSS